MSSQFSVCVVASCTWFVTVGLFDLGSKKGAHIGFCYFSFKSMFPPSTLPICILVVEESGPFVCFSLIVSPLCHFITCSSAPVCFLQMGLDNWIQFLNFFFFLEKYFMDGVTYFHQETISNCLSFCDYGGYDDSLYLFFNYFTC